MLYMCKYETRGCVIVMKKKEFIINDLLSKIYQNYYTEGKLPTQRNLAKFYKVSRYTIQEAISKLNDIGVIDVVQGSGIFIKENAKQNPLIYNSITARSEEHTSELQSRGHLVCRLLLEKKKE